MQYLRSTLDAVRDKYTPARHHSNFRESGQLSPDEFLAAGDYLVYKFPSWSWSDASSPAQRVAYLPEGKQFLVTRAVPCRRRLGGQDVATGAAELQDILVGEEEGDGEGWLSAGGEIKQTQGTADRSREVKNIDDSGKLGSVADDEDDEIPDMDDEEDDDEAIIRDGNGDSEGGDGSLRTYNLYIMYSPYYRTPRLYLSGYSSTSTPLPPEKMMEDIVGDYKDKTVTLEAFPFVDSGLRMASIHPCKHAAVMKVLLDRADAALKLRVARVRDGKANEGEIVKGMEGLEITPKQSKTAGESADKKEGEEWEVLQEGEDEDDEAAIRVDQYLVVFLKFMASVTPGIEHDFTMGV